MKLTNLPFLISKRFSPGLPSSSISIDPHSVGIVESSTAETTLLATISPSLPEKHDKPRETALASNG